MRLLLPGWQGNMNVKWLRRIKVTDGPTHTRDETSHYTDLMPDGKARQFTFVMGVKSVITHPSGEMNMQGPGFYEISGLAWTGAGRIAKVEVSADGGSSWAHAALQEPVLRQMPDPLPHSLGMEWQPCPAAEPRHRRAGARAGDAQGVGHSLLARQPVSLQRDPDVERDRRRKCPQCLTFRRLAVCFAGALLLVSGIRPGRRARIRSCGNGGGGREPGHQYPARRPRPAVLAAGRPRKAPPFTRRSALPVTAKKASENQPTRWWAVSARSRPRLPFAL